VDYFQSLSREARLITPIGARPRASATTLEVTVTTTTDLMFRKIVELLWFEKLYVEIDLVWF